MKIAIVGGGFGLSGHLLAFNALPGVSSVVVADSGSGRIKQKLPKGVAYAPSWRDALKFPVDAVSIAVPPIFQKEIVLAALAQNKHVFCEKPFGLNTVEAEMMLSEANTSDCATAINFQFRYEPGIQELKKRIEAGAIGKLYAVDISWLLAGRANSKLPWTWRNDNSVGGGVIGAFFSHVVDLIWWLTQQEIRTILGHTSILIKHRPTELECMREVTAEDLMTTHMQLDDNITATCRISNCQVGGDGMRIEVRGSEGVIVYHHAPPFAPRDQKLTLSVAGRPKVSIPIAHPENQLDAADTRLGAVYMATSHFVRKVQGDENASPPSFSDGLRVHKVMDGLRQSVISGANIHL